MITDVLNHNSTDAEFNLVAAAVGIEASIKGLVSTNPLNYQMWTTALEAECDRLAFAKRELDRERAGWLK